MICLDRTSRKLVATNRVLLKRRTENGSEYSEIYYGIISLFYLVESLYMFSYGNNFHAYIVNLQPQ